MNITSLGHSCFVFTLGDIQVLIDPFFPSDAAKEALKKHTPDYILITHDHQDHVSGLPEVTLKDSTKIIASFALANRLTGEGYSNVIPCNPGFRLTEIADTEIRMVPALHSSQKDTIATGFLIKHHDQVTYIAGDTGLTIEMELLPRYYGKIDTAILPIGGHFTMDYKDLPLACEMLQCRRVIGCHYDTSPPIKIPHEEVMLFAQERDINLYLLHIGQDYKK